MRTSILSFLLAFTFSNFCMAESTITPWQNGTDFWGVIKDQNGHSVDSDVLSGICHMKVGWVEKRLFKRSLDISFWIARPQGNNRPAVRAYLQCGSFLSTTRCEGFGGGIRFVLEGKIKNSYPRLHLYQQMGGRAFIGTCSFHDHKSPGWM